MALSMQELADARECVYNILEQMSLDNYLFDVEPKETQWQIQLDCDLSGQWQSINIEVDADWLKKCRAPGQERNDLINDWKKRLGIGKSI